MSAPDRLTAHEAIEMGVAKRLKVVIDGKEVHAVNAYCISEGWVDVYPKDDAGKHIVEGDHFKLERRIGKVEVTLDAPD